MERVIHGLQSGIRVKGATSPRWSLADRMAHYSVPGVSIAVIDSGRIVWAKGFGLKTAGTTDSVTPTTLFQAASISKPVASLGTMRLVQNGLLDLDADVNAKLVSWKMPDNAFTRTEKVTLRRLMSHSAGLTVHGFPGYAAGDSLPTVPQILDGKKPANTPPVRADTFPGARFNYSGGGMTVMQLLVTDVTRKPYPLFLRETVLDPIGMDHSTYEQPLPASRTADAATAHDHAGAPITGKWHTYPEVAAAGLWTTPSDLARMIIEVQEARAGRSSKVLNQTFMEQMLTVTKPTPYGLGFGLEGTGNAATFSHGGANAGYRCYFVGFVERGQGAVVMTNSDNGGTMDNELISAIAAEYGWPGNYSREIATVRLGADQLARVVGRYRLASDTFAVSVTAEGGTLRIAAPGLIGREQILPTSDSTFVGADSGLPLRFTLGKSGPATSVVAAGQITATRMEK
jgi:CubicO group peptidase (beta-lactamase class C family)